MTPREESLWVARYWAQIEREFDVWAEGCLAMAPSLRCRIRLARRFEALRSALRSDAQMREVYKRAFLATMGAADHDEGTIP